MDDLLIIILTLVIGAIGAIGNARKKKMASNNPGSVKQSPGGFWNMDEIFMPDEGGRINYQTDSYPASDEIIIDEPLDNHGNIEGQSVVVKKTEPPITNPESETSWKNQISWKKAVIYSEILNRKY